MRLIRLLRERRGKKAYHRLTSLRARCGNKACQGFASLQEVGNICGQPLAVAKCGRCGRTYPLGLSAIFRCAECGCTGYYIDFENCKGTIIAEDTAVFADPISPVALAA